MRFEFNTEPVFPTKPEYHLGPKYNPNPEPVPENPFEPIYDPEPLNAIPLNKAPPLLELEELNPSDHSSVGNNFDCPQFDNREIFDSESHTNFHYEPIFLNHIL